MSDMPSDRRLRDVVIELLDATEPYTSALEARGNLWTGPDLEGIWHRLAEITGYDRDDNSSTTKGEVKK